MIHDAEKLARRIFAEGLNRRDRAIWDEVFAADFVARSGLLGEQRGVEAVKRSFASFVTPAQIFAPSSKTSASAGRRL
ncbi:MAG: hypothetical protein ACR2IK_03910 [Chloroflexota bacterium]